MEVQTDNGSLLTEWRPAKLLSNDGIKSSYALLILNQPLKNLNLLELVWEKGECMPLRDRNRNISLTLIAGYRIAADGGGNRLHDVFNANPSFASLMDRNVRKKASHPSASL